MIEKFSKNLNVALLVGNEEHVIWKKISPITGNFASGKVIIENLAFFKVSQVIKTKTRYNCHSVERSAQICRLVARTVSHIANGVGVERIYSAPKQER